MAIIPTRPYNYIIQYYYYYLVYFSSPQKLVDGAETPSPRRLASPAPSRTAGVPAHVVIDLTAGRPTVSNSICFVAYRRALLVHGPNPDLPSCYCICNSLLLLFYSTGVLIAVCVRVYWVYYYITRRYTISYCIKHRTILSLSVYTLIYLHYVYIYNISKYV